MVNCIISGPTKADPNKLCASIDKLFSHSWNDQFDSQAYKFSLKVELSRLTIVSREANKNQRPLSELFTIKEHHQKTCKCPSQATVTASA